MANPTLLMFVVMVCVASDGLRVTSASRNLPSGLCQQLFDADPLDAFVKDRDYKLNKQGRTYTGDSMDRASRKLFTWVDDAKLRNRHIYSTFIALLDNYYLRTGTSEVVTDNEKKENQHFINALMRTNTMQTAHKYLVSQGLAPQSESSFIRLLYKIWLYLYNRSTYRDSSAFEHVFVGEITGRKPLLKLGGYHSWVAFYLLEKSGKVDYKGHHHYLGSEPSYLSLRMTMEGISKPYGGFFVGTSPQFEFALYTVCFLKFPDGYCKCNINSRRVKVTTYKMRGTNSIGTAYPTVY